MQAGDHLGHGAGAGISPTDPGPPGDSQAGEDAADVADVAPVSEDDLVSAVEDLVRDLVPETDACG